MFGNSTLELERIKETGNNYVTEFHNMWHPHSVIMFA